MKWIVGLPGEVHGQTRELVLDVDLIHLIGADALVELLPTVSQVLDACHRPFSRAAPNPEPSHETSFWRNPVNEALLDIAAQQLVMQQRVTFTLE